jgi:hypothetical protein
MALETVAALGVANAVVQFVDFGTKLISKGKEIYRSADGVLADHAEHAAISSRLADLTRALSASLESSARGKRLSPAEKALQEVTSECLQIADDFAMAIDKLKVTGDRRRWKSFRQAMKSVWKKEGIERQLVKLDRLRQVVIIHLLVVVK